MVGHKGKTYYDVANLGLESRDLRSHMLQNMETSLLMAEMYLFPGLEKVEKEPERACIVLISVAREVRHRRRL